jgi:hypothetical protein
MAKSRRAHKLMAARGRRHDKKFVKSASDCLDNYVNQNYIPATLSPHEGRFAIVTERWVWEAMDAVASGGFARRTKTPAAYGEIVWSWRRDPGATPAGVSPAGNGGKKGRFPGESTYKP